MSEIETLGLNTVVVRKAELIDVLEKNLETHKAQFVNARKMYKDALIKKLQQSLQDARKDRLDHLAFFLPRPPESNADRYEGLIQQLKMDTRTDLVLTQEEFRMYVLDQWAWAKKLNDQVTSYKSVLGKS